MGKAWENVVDKKMNVDTYYKFYRKNNPHAERRELYTIIRLAYEKDCEKQGIHDERKKVAFLKQLTRKLDTYEHEKEFPERVGKTKKTKMEEDILSVEKAIGQHLKNSTQLREGKRSISNVDIDQIIDIAMEQTGKPKIEIESLTRKVIKKYFEKLNNS